VGPDGFAASVVVFNNTLKEFRLSQFLPKKLIDFRLKPLAKHIPVITLFEADRSDRTDFLYQGE
jgi:hypothetical protein